MWKFFFRYRSKKVSFTRIRIWIIFLLFCFFFVFLSSVHTVLCGRVICLYAKWLINFMIRCVCAHSYFYFLFFVYFFSFYFLDFHNVIHVTNEMNKLRLSNICFCVRIELLTERHSFRFRYHIKKQFSTFFPRFEMNGIRKCFWYLSVICFRERECMCVCLCDSDRWDNPNWLEWSFILHFRSELWNATVEVPIVGAVWFTMTSP